MRPKSQREPWVQETNNGSGYLQKGKMKLWNHFGGRGLIDWRGLGLLMIVLLIFAHAAQAGAIRSPGRFYAATYRAARHGAYPCTRTRSALSPHPAPTTA